jgi:hypothetical protein
VEAVGFQSFLYEQRVRICFKSHQNTRAAQKIKLNGKCIVPPVQSMKKIPTAVFFIDSQNWSIMKFDLCFGFFLAWQRVARFRMSKGSGRRAASRLFKL